jgi:hypothetical protein
MCDVEAVKLQVDVANGSYLVGRSPLATIDFKKHERRFIDLQLGPKRD